MKSTKNNEVLESKVIEKTCLKVQISKMFYYTHYIRITTVLKRMH